MNVYVVFFGVVISPELKKPRGTRFHSFSYAEPEQREYVKADNHTNSSI